jgi:hypothetical protein
MGNATCNVGHERYSKLTLLTSVEQDLSREPLTENPKRTGFPMAGKTREASFGRVFTGGEMHISPALAHGLQWLDGHEDISSHRHRHGPLTRKHRKGTNDASRLTNTIARSFEMSTTRATVLHGRRTRLVVASRRERMQRLLEVGRSGRVDLESLLTRSFALDDTQGVSVQRTTS